MSQCQQKLAMEKIIERSLPSTAWALPTRNVMKSTLYAPHIATCSIVLVVQHYEQNWQQYKDQVSYYFSHYS